MAGTEAKDKVRTPRVLIYIPSYVGTMDVMAVESLFTLFADAWEFKLLGWEIFLMFGKRMFIQNARNLAVDKAIEMECDYLMFIDDDMVIKPGDKLFSKLVSHDKDMVAPLFFHRRQPFAPLIFKRKIRATGKYTTFDNILDYDKGLMEVDGVGFGCVLLKVSMLKQLPKPYFLHGDTFGEDLYFCNQVINKGFKIYCDTSIELGHIGDPQISWESTYKDNEKATREFMRQKWEKDEKDAEKMVKKVDIIMPCYHNFDYTKKAVESIIQNTVATRWNLILINDGGDKQLEKYFKQIEKVHDNIQHYTNKKAKGWVKALNLGISKSRAEYVCWVNNDIVIPPHMPDWLERMAHTLDDKTIGGVGPISNYAMGLQSTFNNQAIFLQEHYAKVLVGFCFMTRRDVLDKVGIMDERFGIGGNEDLDYSIRIRDAGYKLRILRHLFIEHTGSVSLKQKFGGMGGVTAEDKRTRKILEDKWGKDKVENLFFDGKDPEDIKRLGKFMQTGEEDDNTTSRN